MAVDSISNEDEPDHDGNNIIILEFTDVHSELIEIRSVLERISYNLETFLDSKSNEYDVRQQKQ